MLTFFFYFLFPNILTNGDSVFFLHLENAPARVLHLKAETLPDNILPSFVQKWNRILISDTDLGYGSRRPDSGIYANVKQILEKMIEKKYDRI